MPTNRNDDASSKSGLTVTQAKALTAQSEIIDGWDIDEVVLKIYSEKEEDDDEVEDEDDSDIDELDEDAFDEDDSDEDD